MTVERQISEVLARYVRAADHRDPDAMSALFVADGVVNIFFNDGGTPRPVATVTGADAIGQSVAGMMEPHPPLGWSHHTTHDHIVTIEEDEATIDAQFIVYKTIGRVRPEGGWPSGASGAQGSVTPVESGYYRPRLRRVDGTWKIVHQAIVLDQPMAFPGA